MGFFGSVLTLISFHSVAFSMAPRTLYINNGHPCLVPDVDVHVSKVLTLIRMFTFLVDISDHIKDVPYDFYFEYSAHLL